MLDLLPASRRRGAGAGVLMLAHALGQNGFIWPMVAFLAFTAVVMQKA